MLNNGVPVRPQTKVAKSTIHEPNPGIKDDTLNLCNQEPYMLLHFLHRLMDFVMD